MSAAAKKAWETRRHHGSGPHKRLNKDGTWGARHESSGSSPAKKAAMMKKSKRIHIHCTSVKMNSSSKATYAPPKRWWDHMTKDPHGSAGKPLSAAAAGHLWFKVYDNSKRLQILKEYG